MAFDAKWEKIENERLHRSIVITYGSKRINDNSLFYFYGMSIIYLFIYLFIRDEGRW